MRQKLKRWLKAVLIILLFLWLLSFAASFDNVLSRKVAEITNKPGEIIREVSKEATIILMGALIIAFAFAIVVASPVVAAVAFVVGAVAMVVGIGSLFNWWDSKPAKPDNVKLSGKM